MTHFAFGLSTIIHILVIAFFWIRINFKTIITLFVFALGSSYFTYKLLSLFAFSENVNLPLRLGKLLDSECKPRDVNSTSQNTVILRLDDVQAHSWREVSMNMINDANKHDIPLVLGLIPVNLEDDIELTNYLENVKCKNEIALHGYDHRTLEYASLNYEEAKNKTLSGLSLFNEHIGIKPITFIPPENEISLESEKAINELGLTKVSSNRGGVYDTNVSMYYYTNNSLVKASVVWDKCQTLFKNNENCIIMFHPQDFSSDLTNIDPAKYVEYTNLLLLIAESGVRVTTISQIQKPDNNKPSHISDTIPASTWIADWDYEDTINYLYSNNNVKEVMPIMLEIDTSGEIIEIDSGLGESVRSVKNKYTVLPTLVNRLDSDLAEIFLSDTSQFDRKIGYLSNYVLSNSFGGIDIDIENIDPSYQKNFTFFIQKLYEKFKAQGLKVSITVPIKTSEGQWKVAFAYDWVLLGKNSDTVRVMAYDIHNLEGSPGSLIPIKELNEGVTNALRDISLQKIDIALPTYAYDWYDGKITSLQYSDITSIKERFTFKETIDQETMSVKLIYIDNGGVLHEIWYENPETLKYKMNLLKEKGIENISFWRLGNHDPLLLK